MVPPIVTTVVDPFEKHYERHCPPGFHQKGDRCVATSHLGVVCGSGFAMRDGVCVSSCPLNFEWNGSMCLESRERHVCPENFVWRLDRCVRSETPVVTSDCQGGGWIWSTNRCGGNTCPEGSTLEPSTGFCEKSTSQCPAGSFTDNGVCKKRSTQCPGGSYESSGRCYRHETTSVTIPPVTITEVVNPNPKIDRTCPKGSYQKNGECVGTTQTCDDGYTLQNNRCVLTRTSCPIHFERRGSSCVERQLCPHSYVWQGDRCVAPQPECHSGWYWNGIRCEIRDIQCPPGSSLRNRECFTEIDVPPRIERLECQMGWQLESSGFCVRETSQCPAGSNKIDGLCKRSVSQCPPETYKVDGQCRRDDVTQVSVPPTITTIVVDSEISYVRSCPCGTYQSKGRCVTRNSDCITNCVSKCE